MLRMENRRVQRIMKRIADNDPTYSDTKFDLHCEGLGDTGASEFADALKKNTNLRRAYLNGNNIGDEGAAAIGKALMYNKTLTKLYLQKNNFDIEGAAAICEALKHNETLNELSGVPLSPEAMQELANNREKNAAWQTKVNRGRATQASNPTQTPPAAAVLQSASANTPTPTSRNTGLAQQTADGNRILAEVQSAADTKTSSQLNLAVVVLSGSGGAGKTSACLAIQGKSLPATRESTRGGEGMALVARIGKKELLGFEKPRDDLNHLQRALMRRLQKERNVLNRDLKQDSLVQFVSGLDSYAKIAHVQEQLETMGGGLASALIDEPAAYVSVAEKAQVSSLPPHSAHEVDFKGSITTSRPMPRGGNGPGFVRNKTASNSMPHASNGRGFASGHNMTAGHSMPHGPSLESNRMASRSSMLQGRNGAGFDRSMTASHTPSLSANEPAAKSNRTRSSHQTHKAKSARFVPVAHEQIHVKRETAIIMRAQQGINAEEVQDGVHTLIFDLGGQPEFWPLVGGFLREKAIISVFGRLDELAANVLHNTSIASESRMHGLDELFLWIDAVAARTTAGHVLLVLSHADMVTREADRRAVSDAIIKVLRQRDHPVVSRLVQPETGLLFYALDNRHGLRDPGVLAYRNKLQQLCEESESAKQRVPLELLRFLDAFNALQRKEQEDDSMAVQHIRASRRTTSQVPYIRLTEAAQLFSSLMGRDVTADLADKEFRLYIDYLHMLGVITHNNAAGLEDLVIIDPVWLLRQETAIVRRPSLHPLPCDRLLAAVLFDSLYDDGILKPEIIPKLWAEHDPRLRLQLLGLMIQAEVVIPLDQGGGYIAFVVPALLPDDTPPAPKPLVSPTIVHVACYTGAPLLQHNYVSEKQLRQRCALPTGLFEQLLAGLVKLGNSSRTSTYAPLLSRRYGFIRLGRYGVELELNKSLRLVTIKFYVENAVTLLQQVVTVIKRTLERQFSSLHFELLAPAAMCAPGYFVQVRALQYFFSQSSDTTFSVEQCLLDRSEVEKHFGSILPVRNQGGVYHVFVSYRHGADSERAGCFVNALSTANVGETGKPMNIFFDNFCLEDGLQFDVTFMRGLVRSLVAVPFVTADALDRMCKVNSEKCIDHVLLEWWLALVLVKAEGTLLRYILPIFCGEITIGPTGREIVGDLFASFDFDQLPDAVNMPTYNRLCTFLSDDLKRADLVPPLLSVRDVVEDLRRFTASGTLCWLFETPESHRTVQDGMSDFGSTQRVFAHCAKPVFAKVEMAVSEKPDAVAFKGPGNAPVNGDSGDLDRWLVLHDLRDMKSPLHTLGVHVLKDLAFGVAEGDISVQTLGDAGAKSSVQSKRLLQTVATILPSSTTTQKSQSSRGVRRSKCALQ